MNKGVLFTDNNNGVGSVEDNQVTTQSGDCSTDFLKNRSFEGNAQSTRIVCNLSFRKEHSEPGLNLTLRSIATIAKYPWTRGNHPHRIQKLSKKWSFYSEEAPVLKKLLDDGYIHIEYAQDNRVLNVHRWPEAEIMDWADDITYAVHDLEDFFRAGLIPLHRLKTAFSQAPQNVNWETTDFDFVTDDQLRNCLAYVRLKLCKLVDAEGASLSPEVVGVGLSKIRDNLLDFFPNSKFVGSRLSHAQLQAFGSALIRTLSATSSLRWDANLERIQLKILPEAVVIAEFFKSLNSFFVIETSMLATMQFGQTETLKALHLSLFQLSITWLATVENPAASRRLPARLRELLAEEIVDYGVNESDEVALYRVHIAVMDYICSLRDIQAMHLADQLRGAGGLSMLAGEWLDT